MDFPLRNLKRIPFFRRCAFPETVSVAGVVCAVYFHFSVIWRVLRCWGRGEVVEGGRSWAYCGGNPILYCTLLLTFLQLEAMWPKIGLTVLARRSSIRNAPQAATGSDIPKVNESCEQWCVCVCVCVWVCVCVCVCV